MEPYKARVWGYSQPNVHVYADLEGDHYSTMSDKNGYNIDLTK